MSHQPSGLRTTCTTPFFTGVLCPRTLRVQVWENVSQYTDFDWLDVKPDFCKSRALFPSVITEPRPEAGSLRSSREAAAHCAPAAGLGAGRLGTGRLANARR